MDNDVECVDSVAGHGSRLGHDPEDQVVVVSGRRSAPRRDVIEVIKVGDWGEVVYRHRLSCGHTDTRKRPAKADVIGCVTCGQMQALEARSPTPAVEVDDLASLEVSIAQMRATIATRCGVPQEAVDVVMSDGGRRLGYVSVMFDADAAMRFTA